MKLFNVIAILLTLTALLSYFNHRYLRLHPSIGVMLIALLLSLGLIGLGELGLGVRSAARDFLNQVHFGDALLTWMLGFLLFAGADRGLERVAAQLADHRAPGHRGDGRVNGDRGGRGALGPGPNRLEPAMDRMPAVRR